MSTRIGRPSPATVIASLALFVALSGSSYAAIKANSVGAKQIKANAVAGAELKDGAVGSADVGTGAITGDDIADGSVRSPDVDGLGAADIADESLGSADVGGLGSDDITDESLGSADVDGLGGADITDGSLARGDVAPGSFIGAPVTAQSELSADLAGGDDVVMDVFCPAGQTAIGGGIRGDNNNSEVTTITGTRPAISQANTEPPANGQSFTGWRGTVVHNTGDATADINPEIWVFCAPTG